MIGEAQLRGLLEKPVTEAGYELVEINIGKSASTLSLNIVVDRDEPISLDDIVDISDLISNALDEANPFEDPYNLDVSSLGAEKPIKIDRLDKYVGRYVNLHLTHPIKGENILEGDILEISEDILLLQVVSKGKKSKIEIPLPHIDKARLAIKF